MIMSHISHTKFLLRSCACCAAGTVLNLPVLRWDLVAAPAVNTVRQTENILVVLEADELTVTRTLILVVSVVGQGCSSLEATDCRHCIGGFGGRWRRNSRRCCYGAPEVLRRLGRGRHHHRCRDECGCELERNHCEVIVEVLVM